MIKVNNLIKVYKQGNIEVCAVSDFSVEILDNEFISIIGKSGSGKSTLLHLLGGLDKPDSGNILIDEVDITKLTDNQMSKFRREKMGFVFQNFNLIPELTAKENIIFPLLLSKKEVDTDFLDWIIKLLDLDNRLDHLPNQLSGGQKQRVAIAGVMAMRPKCIVLDEPTAMLDPNGRKEVLEAVSDLNRREGVTVILITHYMEEVVHADKVYVMDNGEVVMQGTPREIFSQVETLKEYRLDVPQVTLLAHELHKAGVDVPEGILTTEELVNALCQ